ncbi:hypothetical protein [Sodalis sp.]|uniref:hypothetical protein n=1 Tax=Sodalis sp. (in: enterobacteria) TaxID=1898979 RepID=UPI00387397F0
MAPPTVADAMKFLDTGRADVASTTVMGFTLVGRRPSPSIATTPAITGYLRPRDNPLAITKTGGHNDRDYQLRKANDKAWRDVLDAATSFGIVKSVLPVKEYYINAYLVQGRE